MIGKVMIQKRRKSVGESYYKTITWSWYSSAADRRQIIAEWLTKYKIDNYSTVLVVQPLLSVKRLPFTYSSKTHKT